MLSKLHTVQPPAWALLAAMVGMSALSVLARTTSLIPSKTYLYLVQSMLALALAGLAYYLRHGLQDRVRHQSDKAFVVGSVLAVWFVLYFLSGLTTTYVNNSLVTSLKGVSLNLWAFGVTAVAIEYARHSILLLVRRRNVVWFGILVAIVLSIPLINFGLFPQTHGVDGFVELIVSDIIPAVMSSLLLSYLAITSGLPAMLTYRLGLIAVVYLSPIIPKYDWYLQGVSLMVLAVSIYIAIDRTRQDRDPGERRRHRSQPRLASDIMWIAVMVCLALFMVGAFTYKPSAIASNSMKPVFSRGSMVVIEKDPNPMDVKVGDIVQYSKLNTVITHRVIAIDAADDGSGKRVFTTKGDNNPSDDPLISESQLIGTVRAQVPFIGYPTLWLGGVSGRQPNL